MTLYRPVIEENVPRVAIAVGFVFIMVWFLVLIEMCIIRRTDRVRLILNRVVTISKFYSDTEEEGYFCSKASNFSCKTRYCGLYVPSVVLMGLFLLLGSTAIFLCRYALQGKWYTEDIILFSLASCCSFFTFFLLFPLTDTSVSCCCGLRPVSSKYLHQCGGVSFLCFLPLLNFLVLAYIMFYKLFVSRCIALVSCLFIAFLLGGVIYVKKWCSIKATEDRIGNELEIPLDDVEASKKILANFINDPKNGITLADRDVITQEVNEAVFDRKVKRAASLVKKYAALGGLRDDSSASNVRIHNWCFTLLSEFSHV